MAVFYCGEGNLIYILKVGNYCCKIVIKIICSITQLNSVDLWVSPKHQLLFKTNTYLSEKRIFLFSRNIKLYEVIKDFALLSNVCNTCLVIRYCSRYIRYSTIFQCNCMRFSDSKCSESMEDRSYSYIDLPILICSIFFHGYM